MKKCSPIQYIQSDQLDSTNSGLLKYFSYTGASQQAIAAAAQRSSRETTCIPLQLYETFLELGEEIRLVLFGSHTAKVDVPLVFNFTPIVEMYDWRPRIPSNPDVPSVANELFWRLDK